MHSQGFATMRLDPVALHMKCATKSSARQTISAPMVGLRLMVQCSEVYKHKSLGIFNWLQCLSRREASAHDEILLRVVDSGGRSRKVLWRLKGSPLSCAPFRDVIELACPGRKVEILIRPGSTKGRRKRLLDHTLLLCIRRQKVIMDEFIWYSVQRLRTEGQSC